MLRELTRGFYRNFWVLVITWTIFGYATGVSTTFLSDYIVALGGSEAAIGITNTIGQIVYVPSALAGGYIGDRYGRRRIIVRMTWVIVFATSIYFLAPNWWFIPIAMSIEYITKIYIPALMATLADSIDVNRRARGFLLTFIIPGVAALPAPIIGGYIIESIGYGRPEAYRVIFLIAFLLGLVAALIRQLYLVETLKAELEEPLFKAILDSLKHTIKDLKSSLPSIERGVKMAIILNSLLFTPAFGMVWPYMIRYAGLHGVDSQTWGEIVSLATAISVCGGIVLLHILDRVDRRILISSSSIAIALGAYIFSIGNMIMLTIGTILLLGVRNVYWSAYFAYLSDLAPKGLRSRVLALSDVGETLGLALGSLVGAIVYPILPSYIFIIASLLLLPLTLTPLVLPYHKAKAS